MDENKFTHAGFEITIEQDSDPQNPRTENDNFGKLFCSHKRYALGDNHGFKTSDFRTWAEWQGQIEEDYDVDVLLPVYMYDHSGITISTTPFSCQWDSGQIGFIFCTKKQVIEEFKGDTEKARKLLIAEIDEYDKYLRGDVYGYIVSDGKELESCWGFFGYDYCVSEAKSCAEALRKREDKTIVDEEQAALALFN